MQVESAPITDGEKVPPTVEASVPTAPVTTAVPEAPERTPEVTAELDLSTLLANIFDAADEENELELRLGCVFSWAKVVKMVDGWKFGFF